VIVSGRESQGRAASSLWFTDNDTLVATSVVHKSEGKPEVSSRSVKDSTLPFRLRAVFLNASTGRIGTVKDWPTDSRMARIIAVHNGKFVTLAGSELTLYQPNLNAIKSIALPQVGPVGWLPHRSPSGKSVLLSSAERRKASWIWVETDTLEILSSWEDNPSGYLTISDQGIATSTCWSGHECLSLAVNANDSSACTSVGPKCDSEIKIRGLSGNWKTIGSGEEHQYLRFINNSMIFVPGKDTGRVIGLEGKLLFEEPRIHRSWGCWETGVLPAADGRRFVIPSCLWKGGVPSLDIGGHPVLKQIFVYNVGSDIQSTAFEVKGPKVKDQMQFAISPDGSKLAILNNEFVEVFNLPPTQ
jgi:hypothetical protein